MLEKYFLKNLLEKLPGLVRHVYTMVLIMAGWVFFFSPGIGSAVKYIGRMFGIGAAGLINPAAVYYLYNYILLFAVLILCSTPHTYRRFSVFMQQRTGRCRIAIAAYIVMFVLSVAYLVNATYNPFLYFRF